MAQILSSMNPSITTPGHIELQQAQRQCRPLVGATAGFSIFVNLLMLAGPLYMLQVYDRVLSSRSVATLLVLTGLITFLYLITGVLDCCRSRLMARAGARFQQALEKRVFHAALSTSSTHDKEKGSGLRDLDAIQRWVSSPASIALFDLPWTPIFIAGIWMFHPLLGSFALAAVGILVALALLNQWTSRRVLAQAHRGLYHANKLSDQIQTEAHMVQSMGMHQASYTLWQTKRRRALLTQLAATDLAGAFGAATKTIRMFLQSAILGLGAYLVLQNAVSPGVMIASSVLMGRALAPIETLINQRPLFVQARLGWNSLAALLTQVPPVQLRTVLPQPSAKLEVKNLTVIPPQKMQASLKLINFSIFPGQALGVIGPSGAGKSTLAKALTTIWSPAGGTIRLDGASLHHYDPSLRGAYIGYLPQHIHFFDGSITQNIARMISVPDPQRVACAAQKAGAHEMILHLPDGYDTILGGDGMQLSGGQMQRIGLARALYSDPVILILDEPNSNLDNVGNAALNTTIQQMKAIQKSIIIMAHRPTAIAECDILLVLEDGGQTAFGPRDRILASMVQNHHSIARAAGTNSTGLR